MPSLKVVNLTQDPQLDAWEEAVGAAEDRLEEVYGVEDPSEGRVLRELCEAYLGVTPEHWSSGNLAEVKRCYVCGGHYTSGEEAPSDHDGDCRVRKAKEEVGLYGADPE